MSQLLIYSSSVSPKQEPTISQGSIRIGQRNLWNCFKTYATNNEQSVPLNPAHPAPGTTWPHTYSMDGLSEHYQIIEKVNLPSLHSLLGDSFVKDGKTPWGSVEKGIILNTSAPLRFWRESEGKPEENIAFYQIGFFSSIRIAKRSTIAEKYKKTMHFAK